MQKGCSHQGLTRNVFSADVSSAIPEHPFRLPRILTLSGQDLVRQALRVFASRRICVTFVTVSESMNEADAPQGAELGRVGMEWLRGVGADWDRAGGSRSEPEASLEPPSNWPGTSAVLRSHGGVSAAARSSGLVGQASAADRDFMLSPPTN